MNSEFSPNQPHLYQVPIETPAADPNLWLLDPAITFLNHGSFGSCPKPVLDFQMEIRNRMERQPIQFMVRDLEALLDEAREKLAHFVGADPDTLVFVPNATAGVNTVLNNLSIQIGEEILISNHEYNACRNAVNRAASEKGAKVVVADLPFPVKGDQDLLNPLLDRINSRTRIVLVDHVTSQTGLIFPVE